MGDLQQFLDPDAGGSQDLDGGPRPEREVFLHRQVPAFPAGRVVDPDLVAAAGGERAGEGLTGDDEAFPGPGSAGRVQERVGGLASLLDAAHQDRQHGQPLAGAGVHAGLALPRLPCAG